jgi:hypothetical protein
MLLMCHLFIGLVIGLAAFRLTGDRRMVIMAGIGSILPDLIDKPLGHIILAGTVDYGRIYAHTGLFLLALIVVGLAYRKWKGSWLLAVLALGMMSHLLLDSMWELPVTLFYPALGDFGMHYFPNYVEDSLVKEFGSAYEWIFGVTALVTILYVYNDRLGKYRTTLARLAPRILTNLSRLLVIAGLVAIAFGLFSVYNPLSMTDDMESNLIIGLAAVIGGLASLRLWHVGEDPVGRLGFQ